MFDIRMLSLWIIFILVFILCAQSKIIDLSHDHGPDTIVFPGYPSYNRTSLSNYRLKSGLWVDAGAYSTAEHGGTHLDAPVHFSKFGLPLNKIPLEDTIAEGVMIDASMEASKNREYQVTVDKIKDWEKKHGDIPLQAAVIFNFGWYKKFDNHSDYIGTNTSDRYLIRIPTVSEEAARYLYYQREIKIIGTDCLGPEPFVLNGQKVTFHFIHETFLPNNKLIVENLKNTDKLPPRGFRFFCPPVKFVNSSGAPVRAFAVVYDGVRSGAPTDVNIAQFTFFALFLEVFCFLIN